MNSPRQEATPPRASEHLPPDEGSQRDSPVTLSQLGSVYDRLEKEGEAEWARMRQRVGSSTDPALGAKDRLQALVQKLLPEVTGGVEACREFLRTCSADRREAFFAAWACKVYDLQMVEQEWDLRKKPKDQSLKEFFEGHAKTFYTSLLADKCMDALSSQRETSLRAVSPIEMASACERLAVGYGLPKDGHLVHSCVQGQCLYHFMGSDGKLKARAMLLV